MPGRKAPEAERRQQILAAASAVAVRDRLEGLTIRAVAAEAGVSPGLVAFHFGSRDGLLKALLDWLLETTLGFEPEVEPIRETAPPDRLLGLVEQELAALPERRERIELFFDYWVRGTRDPELRRAMRAAGDRLRAMYEPFAAEAIAHDPVRFAGIAPRDLARAAVGLIQGCAVQAIVAPEDADPEGLIGAIRALVRPAAPGSGPPAPRRS
jgi:TetR/AcrR family transcriptional repressor of bet genes